MHKQSSSEYIEQFKRPFFSILIASTGSERLYSALQSISQGADQDYEVILVIDNPKFKPSHLTYERLPNDFKDKLTVLYNEKNIGATISLNRGLAECSGEIICRLDDDDSFLPERLTLVRAYAKKYPDVGVFTGGAIVKDQHGNEYQLSVPKDHHTIAKNLARRNVLVHSALNIRRSVINNVNGYNEDYYFAQDYELYLRLLRDGVKFCGIDQPIVERTEGIDSITVQKRKNQALYSFSALALHHARLWETSEFSPMLITHAFFRFITPQFLRQIARRLRSVRKVARL